MWQLNAATSFHSRTALKLFRKIIFQQILQTYLLQLSCQLTFDNIQIGMDLASIVCFSVWTLELRIQARNKGLFRFDDPNEIQQRDLLKIRFQTTASFCASCYLYKIRPGQFAQYLVSELLRNDLSFSYVAY